MGVCLPGISLIGESLIGESLIEEFHLAEFLIGVSLLIELFADFLLLKEFLSGDSLTSGEGPRALLAFSADAALMADLCMGDRPVSTLAVIPARLMVLYENGDMLRRGEGVGEGEAE